ncbi:hypothetical protein [Nostoc parmelioides]|uniref:Uncharacterized protein n=1 Tax=Nostoc parmelioides FACHB-3921 TaxID=2692909 RepID=A0ABR8BA84_9NOSO|nr:hypothetical protein [Nostoc parmelioides]MBD2250997.1 hypothetical protein [Nostoc parmelioides FACHB-3921]
MTDRTKTSVRLDADVVAIIANYAKSHTSGDKTKALNELVRSAQEAQGIREAPINPPATHSHPEPPSNDLLDKVVLEMEGLKARILEVEQKLDKPQVEDIATQPATPEVGDKVDISHPFYSTLTASEYVEQECIKGKGKGVKTYKVRCYQSLGLVVVGVEAKAGVIFEVLGKSNPGEITIGEDGKFLYGNL